MAAIPSMTHADMPASVGLPVGIYAATLRTSAVAPVFRPAQSAPTGPAGRKKSHTIRATPRRVAQDVCHKGRL